jgi:hypothetical protein
MKEGTMSKVVIKDKVYEQMSEGLHNVTITKYEDLGLQDTQFGTKDRVRIVFQAQDQKDSKTGEPINVFMTATKSLHSKSQLGKLLATLKIPAGAEFDMDDLVGVKCQVVIQHKESEGKTYANIATVLPRTAASAPAKVAENF